MKKTTTIILLLLAFTLTSCSSQKKIEKDSKKGATEAETRFIHLLQEQQQRNREQF